MKKIRPVVQPALVVFFALSLAAGGGLLSCGMEEYSHLPSVPQENIIEVQLNNRATIKLPNINTSPSGYSNFTHFSIVYRIYVSDKNLSSQTQTSSVALRDINYSLAADYSTIYPSTYGSNTSVSTTVDTTGVGALFMNRGYYELCREGGDNLLRNILDHDSMGKTIVLNFPPNPGVKPTLTVGLQTYTLLRSEGEDIIQILPNNPLPTDRYFLNHSQLNAPRSSLTAQDNLDVADTSGTPANRYTYISLYIMTMGLNSDTTPIFGRPTFIGILKLPEV